MRQTEIPDLAGLVNTAIAAGELILEIYGRGDFTVETKADSSPLTEADLAAEALIAERLVAHYPDIPVIAEEAAAAGELPECGRFFFLVDPLDGSKEFIKRNGEFTVNIAVIDNGVPWAGVVYAPALNRIWWGQMGIGSHAARVENQAVASPVKIGVRPAPVAGLTLVGSRSHGSGEDDARLAGLTIADFAAMGSSLKFCLVAEGGADLYPRFGRTMEWDTAAGDAILRAAGGLVLDQTKAPMIYGKRNQGHDCDFANGPFWAIGDNALVERLGGSQRSAAPQP